MEEGALRRGVEPQAWLLSWFSIRTGHRPRLRSLSHLLPFFFQNSNTLSVLSQNVQWKSKDKDGIPVRGNQRSKWDAGCRFDFENPEYR